MNQSDLSLMISQNTALDIPMGVEEMMINKWLEVKTGRSEKTKDAYQLVIRYFRRHLRERGFDVFSDMKAVAVIASDYVKTSYDRRGRVKGGTLSEGTINQRLAILSSFYIFCHKWERRIENPIDLCERESYNVHDAAPHLEGDEVVTALKSIDRTGLQGQRDYALLLLALTTGRRAAELVALTWGDLRFAGKNVEVTWRHCKGNKTMQDILGVNTRDTLESYLYALYGSNLGTLANDAPIFVSLSRNNNRNMMSTQSVADVCRKYLGTSKVHTTRHTFAVNSERAGASLSEIGERLGHASLKTTSDYMKRRHSAENKHIKKLESLYGL